MIPHPAIARVFRVPFLFREAYTAMVPHTSDFLKYTDFGPHSVPFESLIEVHMIPHPAIARLTRGSFHHIF